MASTARGSVRPRRVMRWTVRHVTGPDIGRNCNGSLLWAMPVNAATAVTPSPASSIAFKMELFDTSKRGDKTDGGRLGTFNNMGLVP